MIPTNLDLVDYLRRDGPRGQTGWHGPVHVAHCAPETGQIILKVNGRECACRFQEIRHTSLVFRTYLSGYLAVSPDISEQVLIQAIAAQRKSANKMYGMYQDRIIGVSREHRRRIHE